MQLLTSMMNCFSENRMQSYSLRFSSIVFICNHVMSCDALGKEEHTHSTNTSYQITYLKMTSIIAQRASTKSSQLELPHELLLASGKYELITDYTNDMM